MACHSPVRCRRVYKDSAEHLQVLGLGMAPRGERRRLRFALEVRCKRIAGIADVCRLVNVRCTRRDMHLGHLTVLGSNVVSSVVQPRSTCSLHWTSRHVCLCCTAIVRYTTRHIVVSIRKLGNQTSNRSFVHFQYTTFHPVHTFREQPHTFLSLKPPPLYHHHSPPLKHYLPHNHR
ncbi:hypothetical protein P171DRAFT_255699 [Karstenula rhodostoma CBS 690.94]|uniref:Uncharacterized protein n=1 Tax=Karstenula rhodostoma CBS 690.94 TaxID=1392251 RepID=A0A9P4PJJ3_9PLEO|nr:hypothetical protein P171DRAFT_255699 [Karstenula rhodostoma CBS 690.94]